MTACGIIPARFDSQRFKGKVLEKIKGKSMLWHVYNRAKEAQLLDDVIIATDNKKIRKEAEDFGAEVVMTSPEAVTGTDRIAEVAQSLSHDIIINIQGDEPLIDPKLIDKLVGVISDDDSLKIVTAVYKCSKDTCLESQDVVKVVKDEDDYALYFSRSLIPYPRSTGDVNFYKHLGIYAYRRMFLLTFATLAPSELEIVEGLEQLRMLEYGYKIKIIEAENDSIGVDTPEELEKVKKIMEKPSA
jgi:3-deoxy-manno-octulosonate cytidylyltransferase (CMP-KDO synthetase)